MKKIIFVALFLVAFIAVNAQNIRKNVRLHNIERLPATIKDTYQRTMTRKEISRLEIPERNTHVGSVTKSVNSMWDVQFERNVDIGSGIATNGTSFFVSQWSNDTIYVYDLNGNQTGKNKISVTGIRDLDYDGTYFYGSNASNKIYKMNFTNFTVVDSITCPANISIRHIAYDNSVNAFWVGDWDSDIYLVNHAGQVLNTISASDHELYGMYGSAYDNVTPGGPYLWISDQGGAGCDIVMLKISTGKQTGIIHDCFDDVADDLFEPIAGGLFIYSGLIPGTVTLGGIIQRQRIFGYNLASLVATNDVGVEGVLSPILYSGCTLGGNESVSIRIRNYGLNATSYFTVQMLLNNSTYSINVSTPISSFGTVDVTFPGTFNFSQPDVYKMKFYTNYGYDNNTSNDTGYYNVITGNGLITVDVLTDDYPDETYWEVYNNFTYDVYGNSLGIPMQENTLYSTEMCVDTNLCYGFTIYDFYGDGIYPPGYYEVFFNNYSVAYNDSFSTLFEEIPYIGHCDYADIGVVGIVNPVSSCLLTDEEFITVIVKNFGTQTVTNASVSYSLNGNIFSEPLPFSLDSQEEGTFTFVNTCDLSTLGQYNFIVYTELPNDMNPYNDTTRDVFENYVPAQVPYIINFDNSSVNAQLLVEDENLDYFTWSLYNTGGTNNSSCAIYSFNPNEPANDWLFTKCLNLNSGQTYTLNFYSKAQDPLYPEKLKVHLAQVPSSAAVFSDPITDLINIIDTFYTLTSVPFNVDDMGSGSYYIAFNVYSSMSGWNLYLDDISITNVGSINEDNFSEKLSIFPNPAQDVLTVTLLGDETQSSCEKQIFVYDLQGQLLYKHNFTQQNCNVDISSFEKGMYIIKIETEDSFWVRKFIKN
ncbi:MAG: T9SS type A sorting domain-containing protein [Bacteroidales bacterium]|nr:T9SS type A sorting domain-containing protein [Bacteroidales bacterium]